MRHLLRVVAPGQTAHERVRGALVLPRRIRADIAQARSVLGVARGGRLPGRNVLWTIVDKRPDPLADSGSLRLTWILLLALRLGYEVAVYSVRESAWFRVRGDNDELSLDRVASEDVAPGAIAWVVQPQAAAVVLPVLATVSQMHVIYDSVDVHHLRHRREANVTRSRGRRLQARLMRRLERRVVRAADVTIAVSDDEVAALADLGAKEVLVLPNIHQPRTAAPPPWSERSALLFVGTFTHSPNVDAVDVLVREIMPRVWVRHPTVELAIVGRAYPQHHFGQLDPRIIVHGWIPDLERIVDSSCLLVAPLRFGAGLKGKIGFALANGLPVVTTTVGAEGYPRSSGMDVCDVGAWGTFAELVATLVEDEDSWIARSEAGIHLVREFFSPVAIEPRVASILRAA